MPELAREVSLAVPATLLPLGAYVSVNDPIRPGRKVEMNAGEVLIPEDADHFVLWVDRTQFPDTENLVFKARAWVSYDDGEWELLTAFTTRGGIANGRDGRPLTHTTAQAPLKMAKTRRAKVEVAILRDTNVEVGVLCVKASALTARVTTFEAVR